MTSFQVAPHEKAPLFSNYNDASTIISQLIKELASHNPARSKEVFEYIRQAGFVNLWFFLKYIASAGGPYKFLNEGVHLDLANFRQSEYCMRPGASAAIVLPRGFAKTTIATHGAAAWEALRNPNIRMRIINAVIERAHQFKRTAQRVFDSNSLFAFLYPEYVPNSKSKRWNENEMVIPNATELHKEPTIAAGGVTGASEGDHHDVLVLDDLVGMDDIDVESGYQPRRSMATVAGWMDANLETLLVSPMESRRIAVFTRYGQGDVYQRFFDDCRSIQGYTEGLEVKTDKSNTWDIYYRHVVENGVATNPYVMTVEKYEKLLQTKPIVAALHYANNVKMSVTNELAQFPTKACRLISLDDNDSDYILARVGPNEDDPYDPTKQVLLSECAVCLSVDWAGSKRARNARTSRTSMAIWALDHRGRYYRIAQTVGYLGVDMVFNAMFALYRKFVGFIQATLIEENAMQLGLGQLLRREQERENLWLGLVTSNAQGDKVVRIRQHLSTPLFQGRVYLGEHCSAEFTEEQMSFPSTRLDVLDESSKAFAWLVKPLAPKERLDREYAIEDHLMESNSSAFGY